jgi:hypothetical protein
MPFRVLLLLIVLLPGAARASDNCEAEVSIDCGSAPSVAFSSRGSLWAAFVQGQHVYITRSDDLAKMFSTPVRVNSKPEDIYARGENRPKIGLGSRGEIYLSWTEKTAGKYTGNIRFSFSVDEGRSFAAPRTINTDRQLTSHRFDQLYVAPDGSIFLAWLDKRDKLEAVAAGEDHPGSAVYFAVSRDSGKTFSENYRVANNSCECCRMAMAPAGQDRVALMWRHIFNDSTRDHAVAVLAADGSVSGVARASYDEWKINACPHHGPDMEYAGSQRYHLAWFSNGQEQQGLYYGKYDFARGKPEAVRQMDSRPGAGHPQVETLAGRVIYLWKYFDGERSQVLMSESANKGANWSSPRVVLETALASDHPLLVKHEGQLYLSWLIKGDYRLLSLRTGGEP